MGRDPSGGRGDTRPMERPNTVAGLVAKRDELASYRKSLEAEVRKVTPISII